MSPRAMTPRPGNATVALTISDSSQVGEARRAAAALTTQLGFNETRAGEVAIVITELANNLIRHGGGGETLLRPIAMPAVEAGDSGGGSGEAATAGSGLEMLVLDKGPGIANVNGAMRDGFSSGRTPGTGLGAAQRLSSLFDIHSQPGRGTAIVSRIWPGEVPKARMDFGVVCVPLKSETVCGDAWCVIETAGRVIAILADGLGHGPSAADASQKAIRVFRAHAERRPKFIVEQLHAELRGTRGAAISVAEIDRQSGKIRFCGVGNVAGAVVAGDGRSKSFVTHNGTLGAEARRIIELEQPWVEKTLLILSSDGITSRWQLAEYPSLNFKHPSLIAGILYRDHTRGRDDSTVLTIRV